ncbi:hypothetical protein D3C73_618660 [compost metagenome]
MPRFVQALALQPANVVAITRHRPKLRFPAFAEGAVDLEEIVHQQRTAPGIDEDVVVAHHEPVARRAHTDQTQVERRLVEQIEPRLAFGLEQGLQLRLLLGFGEIAPVEVFDRRAARFVDHLQHVFADVPAERRAQRFVAGDHRLPGLGETLRVEFAVDAVAVLHVVQAGARLQQGVQQHAFLHRGQRVDVFDSDGRHRQRIQLRLIELRQREVRRRQATGVVAQAMLDQTAQLTEVGIGQLADGGRIEAFGAERPAQYQFTAIHLAVDAQLVGQRCMGIVGRADGFIQWMEQRVRTEALVELAEVVEGNRCLRQRRHAAANRLIGEVTQHAMTQAFVRHGTQLFLDRLDRDPLPGGFFDVRRRQAQRIGTGEPAHRAGQVDVVEQRFAAVAFQLDQRRWLTAPAAQHAGQSGQQQVVDLGAIGTWRLLQQLPRTLAVETHADGLRMTVLPPAFRVIAGQIGTWPGQLRLPPAQLFAQGLAAGVGLQACGPVLEGAGFRRQFHRLPCFQLAIQGLQVIEQHPPRHTVHHQVVNGDKQALLAFRAIDQQHAQQGSLFKVETALGIGEQGRAFIHRRNTHLPQNRRIGNRLVQGLPLAGNLAKTQAQGVVLFDHRQQCLLQAMRFQHHRRLQQQRLVPVLALRDVGVEEPVLDRCQARLAHDQALLGADLLAAGGHGGEGLHGLVLEQVARAEVNALLPRPADHLDRQDRVTAQFEEIVVETDLLDVQHVAPDLRQRDFELVGRRHVVLAIQLRVRCRERAAVEFTVAGQRHARQQDQVRGHHVIRQLRFQMRLEGLAQHRLLRFVLFGDIRHQIADQLFAARCVKRQHDCLAD